MPAVDPGEGPGHPPLFLLQTETWRSKQNFFWRLESHPVSQGLDDCPPPFLTEGLDLPLHARATIKETA